MSEFRENVANGFTPQPEAISDEGLFYDYYFETGERAASDALFAPRYATAVSDTVGYNFVSDSATTGWRNCSRDYSR